MKLHFAGSPEIRTSRAQVWSRLMDPNFVAQSAPGVESVEVSDPTHFTIISGFGVGPFKLRFTMSVELTDLAEPERATMRARGKAPGSNVDVVANLTLQDASSGAVRLNWAAETNVSGAIAGLGARLLEGTARKFTEEFWSDFARRAQADAR